MTTFAASMDSRLHTTVLPKYHSAESFEQLLDSTFGPRRDLTGEETVPPSFGRSHNTPPGPPIVSYCEEYRCPACDGQIPPAMVQRRKPTAANALSATLLSIYCPHCRAGWEGAFSLRDGMLRQCSAVTRLEGPYLAELARKVAANMGDIRVKAADPNYSSRVLELADVRRRLDMARAQVHALRDAEDSLVRRIHGGDGDWTPADSLDQETADAPRRLDLSTAQV